MSGFERSLALRAAQVPDAVTVRPAAVWREVRRRRGARRRARAAVGACVLATGLAAAAVGSGVGASVTPPAPAALSEDGVANDVSAVVDATTTGVSSYAAPSSTPAAPSSGPARLHAGTEDATTAGQGLADDAEALARALTEARIDTVAVGPTVDGTGLTVWPVGVLDVTTRAAVEHVADHVVPDVPLAFEPGTPWTAHDPGWVGP